MPTSPSAACVAPTTMRSPRSSYRRRTPLPSRARRPALTPVPTSPAHASATRARPRASSCCTRALRSAATSCSSDSAPAAWARCSPPTTRSSIARSRSSCCARARSRRLRAAPASFAKRRRWRDCSTRTSSPCTTSARSRTGCSSRWSSSTARPSANGRAATTPGRRCCACFCRPVAGSQRRTALASSTATSSPTTSSSAPTAGRACWISASRGTHRVAPRRSTARPRSLPAPTRRSIAATSRASQSPSFPILRSRRPSRAMAPSWARPATWRPSSCRGFPPTPAAISSASASRCTKRSTANGPSAERRSRRTPPRWSRTSCLRRRKAARCPSSCSPP